MGVKAWGAVAVCVLSLVACGGSGDSSCAPQGVSCIDITCCAGLPCTANVCGGTTSSAKTTCVGKQCSGTAGLYQECTNGTTSYYLGDDGTKFPCDGILCTSAAQELASWCQTATSTKFATAQPCTSDTQCATPGLCYSGITGNDEATSSSWCSPGCNSDTACGSNAWCLEDNQHHYRCFPDCNTSTVCSIYGPTITCQQNVSIDNAPVAVCAGP